MLQEQLQEAERRLREMKKSSMLTAARTAEQEVLLSGRWVLNHTNVADCEALHTRHRGPLYGQLVLPELSSL